MVQTKGWCQTAFVEKGLLSDYPREIGFGYLKRANPLGIISEEVIKGSP